MPAYSAQVFDQKALDEQISYRVRFGRYDDIKLLLNNGANSNTVTSIGDPLLSLAVSRHDEEAPHIVQLLLDAGANPNALSRDETAPIMTAARNGQKQMIIALLAHGADYHLVDGDGKNLVEIARQSQHPESAQPLEEVLSAWEKYNSSRTSPGRYESLLRRYTIYSCSYQYWNYYLVSGQDTDHESQTKRRIEQDGIEISKLTQEIQTYYPFTSSNLLKTLADGSEAQIRSDLDSLISNRNRHAHGVGQPADDEKRCKAISDTFAQYFTPP